MKYLTFVIAACVVLIPPAATDAVTTRRDVLEEAGQEGSSSSSRRKRSVFHLFNMVTCATGCNPLSYKGYGCYCGFLGSGLVVDGIDRCCKGHDWCYEHSSCLGFDHYLAPYRWKCNGGNPYCVATRGLLGGVNSCGHQLCECDREFVECLKQHPCPKTKAICMTSPWRYWQNLFMGLSSGSGMHHADEYSSQSPPSSSPQEDKLYAPPSPSSSLDNNHYAPPSQSPPQEDNLYSPPSSPPPSPTQEDNIYAPPPSSPPPSPSLDKEFSPPLPLSPHSKFPSSQEEKHHSSSPLSSPEQSEEYNTVAPPPTPPPPPPPPPPSSIFSHDKQHITTSSPFATPSLLYQDPSSSTSPSTQSSLYNIIQSSHPSSPLLYETPETAPPQPPPP